MKNAFILFVLFFSSVDLFAQENTKLDKEFTVLLGVKATPFDFITGGIFGFNYRIQKFSTGFRNDVNFKIGKVDTLAYYGITEFRIINYFDLQYHFNPKLTTFLGYGWVSNRDPIYRFSPESGYEVITLGANYMVTPNIYFELRGDIPLIDLRSPIDLNIAFPGSVSLIYKLR